MNIREELNEFKPVILPEVEGGIDLSFTENYLKLFTKLAKSQQKTQQIFTYHIDEIAKKMEQQDQLVQTLKEQKNELYDENEKLLRFLIDTIELIYGFSSTAEKSGNSELISVSKVILDSFIRNMQKIGLSFITAIDEIPDSLYHFVVASKETKSDSEKGRIIEVVRNGFLLNGKIIKKAEVIIGK